MNFLYLSIFVSSLRVHNKNVCIAVGIREERSIILQNKANGILNHLNFPQPQPSNIDFTQHIVAPLGEVILLEVHNVGISETDCHTANQIEVRNQCAEFI